MATTPRPSRQKNPFGFSPTDETDLFTSALRLLNIVERYAITVIESYAPNLPYAIQLAKKKKTLLAMKRTMQHKLDINQRAMERMRKRHAKKQAATAPAKKGK